MERDMNPMPDDLTPEELMAEADSAEALPERAAMSTLNVTSLDAAGGAVEAVGDHVPDASATDAGAAKHGPPPQAVAAGHDGSHGHAAQHGPPAQPTATQHTTAPAEQGAGEQAPQTTPPAETTPATAPTSAEAPQPEAATASADPSGATAPAAASDAPVADTTPAAASTAPVGDTAPAAASDAPVGDTAAAAEAVAGDTVQSVGQALPAPARRGAPA